MPVILNVLDQIKRLVTNFYINEGRDAHAAYVGEFQWKELEAIVGKMLGDDFEVNGVPVLRVNKTMHLRVA
jgi:hypothetical protein